MTTMTFVYPPATETFAAVQGVVAQRGMRDDHLGWGWGGWVAMVLMMAIFWAAVAAIVIWVVRSMRRHPAGPSGSSSALDIARDRYARGEISDEEFQRIKRGLA